MFKTVSKKFHSLSRNAVDILHAKLGPDATQPTFLVGAVVVVLLLATVPIETSQLSFGLFGAVTYALLQSLSLHTQRLQVPNKGKYMASRKANDHTKKEVETAGSRWNFSPQLPGSASKPQGRVATGYRTCARTGTATCQPPLPRTDVRKPSSQPVSAPVFQNKDWDAAVDELVGQISPTPEGERIVKNIAAFVEDRIKPLIPEAEVSGFATGDFVRGTAFGVAVPEVDIIIHVSQAILAQRLQGRFSKGSMSTMRMDVRKLHKSAIRACTDRLVAPGGFKFRRSAFRGEEPKVTMLVPASFGVSEESIPIDFSVNSVVPIYNMILVAESAKRDARSRALILFVKRWAKDRGVCHAAKGHLSPYQWSLLVIYFLQVGNASGPLLPPVEDFGVSPQLVGNGKWAQQQASLTLEEMAPPVSEPQVTTGTFFKEFIHFYNSEFDWTKEAVCVRSGVRAPPGFSLPLHIIVDEVSQKSMVGPSIEDPFKTNRNLGGVMTARSLVRLREEIERAATLCARQASLTELLEPWAPPEQGGQDGEEDDRHD